MRFTASTIGSSSHIVLSSVSESGTTLNFYENAEGYGQDKNYRLGTYQTDEITLQQFIDWYFD